MKNYQKKLITDNIGIARFLAKEYRSDRFDSLSEAYFALVIAATRYRKGNAKFSTYAWTVIKNHFIDLNRKKQLIVKNIDWQQVESNDEELSGFAKFLAREDRRFGRLERREDRGEIISAIKNVLSAEEIRLLVYILQERSQTEIADRLRISQSTVSRQIQTLAQKVMWAIGD